MLNIQIAHHGNNRKQGMFEPHMGMLYELSQQNKTLYEEGNLPLVELDFQTNCCYSLHDRFHFKGKKKGFEKSFRDINQCRNLTVNTSVAEQRNSIMAKDR